MATRVATNLRDRHRLQLDDHVRTILRAEHPDHPHGPQACCPLCGPVVRVSREVVPREGGGER